MGIGVIELVVIVAVIALVARGIGAGTLLFWAITIVGVLALLFLGRAVTHTHLVPGPAPDIQFAYQHDGWTHSPHGEMSPTMPQARLSMFGLLLLFAFPAAMFVLVRRLRHHGPHGMVPLAGAATIALLFAGIFFVRSSHRNVYIPPPIQAPMEQRVAMSEAPSVEAEVPMDDLLDRYTTPQIVIDDPPAEAASTSEDQLAAQRAAVQAAFELAHVAKQKLEAMTADATTVTAEATAEMAEAEHNVPPGAESADVAEAPESSPPAEQPHVLQPTLLSTTPQPKPEWVLNPPKLDGPVQRVVVRTEPCFTPSQCEEELRKTLSRAVQEHVQELANEWMGRDAFVPEPEWMGVSNSMIQSMVMKRFDETTQTTTVGEVKTVWAMLDFDQDTDHRLLRAWQTYARRDGIAITAVGSLGVLGALGLVYGLISVDTWTRGYYTKRLFIGVPAAIIGTLFIFLIAGK